MSIKSIIAKPYAMWATERALHDARRARQCQKNIFEELLFWGSRTIFGKDHHLTPNLKYDSFAKQVPITDYEAIKHYIERVKNGERNILWRGLPLYFAKTSGTTSGVKYIPVTADSIGNHIDGAKMALLFHIRDTGNADFVSGKMIFLSGSPKLAVKNKIQIGRLSGIVQNHVPKYLQHNRLPSFETNCIEEWETKLDYIVEETANQDMTLISGIPPWVQMYFDRLVDKFNRPIKDIFPNFNLLVHGGVNFEPYRPKLETTIGKTVAMIGTYPASEGFFAYQTSQADLSLLLNVNAGIFYEFIPIAEIFNPNPTRLRLHEVSLDTNYAVIITTNAGLWSYNLGDTVKFTELNPYRVLVTGRVKHFISAFGEHVIGEEVEAAILTAANHQQIAVTEFTVAPQIETHNEPPYHEWYVEFGNNHPQDLQQFAREIDETLQAKNVYYADLRRGNILQCLKIRPLVKGAFQQYMKSIGKLGGQNKVPRLANDRSLVNQLNSYLFYASN